MPTIPQRFAILYAVCLVAVLCSIVALCIQDAGLVYEYCSAGLAYFQTNFWIRVSAGVFGGFSIWMGLLLIMALIGLNSGSARQIHMQGENGTLILSLDAVEDLLRRRGSKTEGVKELRIHVFSSRKGVKVDGDARVDLSRPIPEFAREFQHMIRTEMSHTFGIDQVADVSVRIHTISEVQPPPEAETHAAPGEASTEPAYETSSYESDSSSYQETQSYTPGGDSDDAGAESSYNRGSS